MYKAGSRIRHLSTHGYPMGDVVESTWGTGYETSTASATSLYIPNIGVVRATATGYYTIQKPDAAGQDLVIFTQGTTDPDQFFRVCSAGSGAGNCFFAHGTGTSFAVIANSSQAPCSIHLKSLSTSIWLLMTSSGTSFSAYAVTTSS
jgi:hypothetical protein